MNADLKTRCPHCQTAFRVSASQLEAARGMVRCGQCFRAFNARQRLFGADRRTAVSSAPGNDPRPPRRPSRPLEEDDFYIDDDFDLSRLEERSSRSPVEDAVDDEDFYIDDDFDLSRLDRLSGEPATAASEPATRPSRSEREGTGGSGSPAGADEAPQPDAGDGVREAADRLDPRAMADWRSSSDDIIGAAEHVHSQPGGAETANRPHWLWYPASLAALLLLGLQLVYFNSRQIEPESPVRPVAEALCGLLDCPLSSRPQPQAVVTRNLVIRSHPSADNALLVDAELINRGDSPRPYPPLRLRFEDLQGRPVAQRTFEPAEYLRDGLAQQPMPAGQPVKLELELADPGERAVSFRLNVAK